MSKVAQFCKKYLPATLSLVTVASLALTCVSAEATPSLQPVLRLYNKTSIQHLMTIDSNEATVLLGNPAWKSETASFQAFPASNGSCSAGTEPVYRIVNKSSGEHLLTADSNEMNFWTVTNHTWYSEGVGFCVYSTQVAGTTPVYRVYNSVNGEHLLTADQAEVNALNGHNNWSLETNGQGGIVFYANR